jgi:hypothetical protein
LETGAGEIMNAAIYRLLLRLYPVEFRRRWEEEMVYTFELQLAENWLEAWTCALSELAPISGEELAIPVVSVAGAATLFFGLIWALANGMALRSLYIQLVAKLGG